MREKKSQCMVHRLGGSANSSICVYTMVVISSVMIGCCAGSVGASWPG